jgi:hypothetical protein
LLPEGEEKQEDIEEASYDISPEEEDAGRALIMGLLHATRTEQEKSRLYFTLIPLAFVVGLLLGYYISFIDL